MARANDSARLSRFYGEMTSLDSIVGALAAEELELDQLSAADLYTRGLDCHNLGGHPQLEHIASAVVGVAPLGPADHVLDLGCGMGGPGRFIADRFGCRVLGIDLVQVRIDTARALSEMTGSSDRVDYRIADATALPVGDRSFRQVWMLDASIHVRDKRRLFAEISRVLTPGGHLVLHDQLGPLPKAMLPVRRRAPYYAPSLTQMVRLIEDAGLRLVLWQDTTDVVRTQFREITARLTDAAPARSTSDRGKGAALLRGYVETLESSDGRTGFLIARRTEREPRKPA